MSEEDHDVRFVGFPQQLDLRVPGDRVQPISALPRDGGEVRRRRRGMRQTEFGSKNAVPVDGVRVVDGGLDRRGVRGRPRVGRCLGVQNENVELVGRVTDRPGTGYAVRWKPAWTGACRYPARVARAALEGRRSRLALHSLRPPASGTGCIPDRFSHDPGFVPGYQLELEPARFAIRSDQVAVLEREHKGVVTRPRDASGPESVAVAPIFERRTLGPQQASGRRRKLDRWGPGSNQTEVDRDVMFPALRRNRWRRGDGQSRGRLDRSLEPEKRLTFHEGRMEHRQKPGGKYSPRKPGAFPMHGRTGNVRASGGNVAPVADKNGQMADKSEFSPPSERQVPWSTATAAGRRPTWVWWTSGKDAAWVLRLLLSDAKWDVRGLLAAVTKQDGRSWLHGARPNLLAKQAEAVGLPLRTIEVDPRDDPPGYDEAVRSVCGELRSEGAEFVAFGDLFSVRRRRRRIQLLQGSGLEAVFPLWGRDSRTHAREMLGSGLSARVCSLVPTDLPVTRVGMRFDETFLEHLPPHVDPCGEHDEFHTFVEWCPDWRRSVSVAAGRRFERHGLAIADLWTGEDAARQAQPAVSADEGFPGAGIAALDYFERLRRVRRHVTKNLSGDLRSERAAAVAGLAGSSFRHYFRKRVGMTYGVWLVWQRMETAARLLREGDSDVAVIGEAVGYPIDRSFRRAFRKCFGLSPSRYREFHLAGRLGEPPAERSVPGRDASARRGR